MVLHFGEIDEKSDAKTDEKRVLPKGTKTKIVVNHRLTTIPTLS